MGLGSITMDLMTTIDDMWFKFPGGFHSSDPTQRRISLEAD